MPEPRRWNEYPELHAIADAANQRDYSRAFALLDAAALRFPDHDFIFGWRTKLLSDTKRYTEALVTALKGLQVCKDKFKLCDTMGDVEYGHGYMLEAVMWWTRSVVLQLSINRVSVESPVLYLAYAAAAVGDEASWTKLIGVVDQMTEYGRLNERAQERIHQLCAKTLYAENVTTAQLVRAAVGELSRRF